MRRPALVVALLATTLTAADATLPITPDQIDDILEHFHTNYEREYTYRLDAPVELVTYHLIAMAEVDKLKPEKLPPAGGTATGATWVANPSAGAGTTAGLTDVGLRAGLNFFERALANQITGAVEEERGEDPRLRAAIAELTQGRGVDKVIECVGSDQDETVPEAVECVKPGGLVVVVGSFAANRATLPIIDFKFSEKTIKG